MGGRGQGRNERNFSVILRWKRTVRVVPRLGGPPAARVKLSTEARNSSCAIRQYLTRTLHTYIIGAAKPG